MTTAASPIAGLVTLPSESPYIDILSDLLAVLHGKGYMVDETPMMHLAVLAIEYELADRMLDEAERARAELSN